MRDDIAPQERLFIICTRGQSAQWVLTLDGYATRADALAAVRWQLRLAGNDVVPWSMEVCRPDPERRGVFVQTRPPFASFTPSRGYFTADAWRDMLDSLWPVQIARQHEPPYKVTGCDGWFCRVGGQVFGPWRDKGAALAGYQTAMRRFEAWRARDADPAGN